MFHRPPLVKTVRLLTTLAGRARLAKSPSVRQQRRYFCKNRQSRQLIAKITLPQQGSNDGRETRVYLRSTVTRRNAIRPRRGEPLQRPPLPTPPRPNVAVVMPLRLPQAVEDEPVIIISSSKDEEQVIVISSDEDHSASSPSTRLSSESLPRVKSQPLSCRRYAAHNQMVLPNPCPKASSRGPSTADSCCRSEPPVAADRGRE